ncbi:TetR/AcrR family transcriptional regulator [Alkaliphilus serpentinus]|nr:TetR/AcrR family transcriptional regulator [Alkaliphilus serpentinus]
MYKKDIQKKRMMRYFIDATKSIVENEGHEAVTVRKVADIAGYNSATLYNYFDNLDHLLFFSSMNYLKDYVIALPEYLTGCKDPLDKYFRIWRCFCYFSYNNPKIYNILFFNRYSHLIKDAVKEYYSIFPEELGDQPEDLLRMLLKNDISSRNITLLEAISQEGLISQDDIGDINDMTILIYQGMLSRVLYSQWDSTIDEAIEKTLSYFKHTIRAFNEGNDKL